MICAHVRHGEISPFRSKPTIRRPGCSATHPPPRSIFGFSYSGMSTPQPRQRYAAVSGMIVPLGSLSHTSRKVPSGSFHVSGSRCPQDGQDTWNRRRSLRARASVIGHVPRSPGVEPCTRLAFQNVAVRSPAKSHGSPWLRASSVQPLLSSPNTRRAGLDRKLAGALAPQAISQPPRKTFRCIVSSDERRPPSERTRPRSVRDSASIGSMRSFIHAFAMPSLGWMTIMPLGSCAITYPIDWFSASVNPTCAGLLNTTSGCTSSQITSRISARYGARAVE